MGGRSRDRTFGDRLRAAQIQRKAAEEEARRADHRIVAAECEIWSAQMEGYGGPSQPSPTIGQSLRAGYFFLEVKCHRCEHRGPVDLRALRWRKSTPIWQLEALLSCEQCSTSRRSKARVHMIKLSGAPDTVTPWYSPEETDRH